MEVTNYPSPATPAALEKIPHAAKRMACSVSQVYRECAAGRLGPICKLSARSSAIPSASVDAWIQKRIVDAVKSKGGAA